MTILFEDTQPLRQLEARRGGYYYAAIPATVVESWPKTKKTRLICIVANALEFQCGLNPLGNGDFFIILSQKNVTSVGLQPGDSFNFFLLEDPNPLGVAIPETIKVLLEQDDLLSKKFDTLTDGKKRAIIHQINRIKNVGLQIERAQKLIWITS